MVPRSVTGEAGVHGQVRELVERWRRAEASNDGEDLGRLLSDDFVGVGPRGWRRTKQQWTGRYTSGTVVNTRFDLDDVDVRSYGDAAVVVAAQRQDSRNGASDASGQFRCTIVTVRTAGEWLIAGLHIGPFIKS
jgi:uncharacterized protein (TIGR02246 family)